MFVRTLIVSLVAMIAVAGPARADCADASSATARLICDDPVLQELEMEIDAAYDQAWSRSSEADRPFLAGQQKQWLVRRTTCSTAADPNATDDKKGECLAESSKDRLEKLRNWPELGRVRMLGDFPSADQACRAALDRKNIGWSWDIVYSQDRFDPLVPVAASEPAWTSVGTNPNVRHGRFDLLNEGAAKDVYLIESDEEARTQFQWYVIADDSEREIIRWRIESLSKAPSEAVNNLAKDLRRDRIEGYRRGPSVFKDVFGANSKPGTLKSVLVAAANSNFFLGAYARSRAFSIDGTTYISAVDYQGRIALLQPNPDGSLTALCRHDAVHSTNRPHIEVKAEFECPYQAETLPIQWHGESRWDLHAIVALDAWGGKRAVASRMQSAGMMFATSRIVVGQLNNETSPAKNEWPPLEAVDKDHDSTELMITPDGPHIAVIDWLPLRPSDSPLGSSYYRIVDNRLIEVCRVTEERLPPPGYAATN